MKLYESLLIIFLFLHLWHVSFPSQLRLVFSCEAFAFRSSETLLLQASLGFCLAVCLLVSSLRQLCEAIKCSSNISRFWLPWIRRISNFENSYSSHLLKMKFTNDKKQYKILMYSTLAHVMLAIFILGYLRDSVVIGYSSKFPLIFQIDNHKSNSKLSFYYFCYVISMLCHLYSYILLLLHEYDNLSSLKEAFCSIDSSIQGISEESSCIIQNVNYFQSQHNSPLPPCFRSSKKEMIAEINSQSFGTEYLIWEKLVQLLRYQEYSQVMSWFSQCRKLYGTFIVRDSYLFQVAPNAGQSILDMIESDILQLQLFLVDRQLHKSELLKAIQRRFQSLQNKYSKKVLRWRAFLVLNGVILLSSLCSLIFIHSSFHSSYSNALQQLSLFALSIESIFSFYIL